MALTLLPDDEILARLQGVSFQQSKDAWLTSNQKPLVATAINAIEAAMLKVPKKKRRVVWYHWWRTYVDKRWTCCRGDVFNDYKWRWMIFIFILSFASLEEFLEAITGLFSVLFSRELRQVRKDQGDVFEAREHSFMFDQAKRFMDACLLHVAVYFRTGVVMPYTRVGLFLLKLGLIKEETVDGVRLFCYDGHFMNDSQHKYYCLKLLLPSYLKITFLDETTMRLWRAKDYEGLHKHFRENCEAVLDVGYPDAEIKEGSRKNMKNLRKVKEDQHKMVSVLS